MRLLAVVLLALVAGACAWLMRPLDAVPLCGPEHPEYLDPRCRKLAEEGL